MTKALVVSYLNEGVKDILSRNLWHLGQQERGYLYRCCVRWRDNPKDAEDALSQAMMKAWEKVGEGVGQSWTHGYPATGFLNPNIG
ncbi:hypothetical protein QUB63_20940 [Microcoleus sp. ARI1-B5]|uniref:hypothetical protein n=1 Tax=unclassified Microcoleus TaxID=2642155 RepID=UPI002FD6E946